MAKKATGVEAYIAQFPAGVQSILEKMRETIRRAAPDAEETIGYRMPASDSTGS